MTPWWIRTGGSYLGVYAQVFPARQAEAHKVFLLLSLFGGLGAGYAVVDQPFELREGLFDLRHRTRAVDEFAFGGVELWEEKSTRRSTAERTYLLIGHDQG